MKRLDCGLRPAPSDAFRSCHTASSRDSVYMGMQDATRDCEDLAAQIGLLCNRRAHKLDEGLLGLREDGIPAGKLRNPRVAC